MDTTKKVNNSNNIEDKESNKSDDINDLEAFDEDSIRQRDLSLTEAEKEVYLNFAKDLKEAGNSQFKNADYLSSALSYTEALKICPLVYVNERSIFYSNRAAAKHKMGNKEPAIENCTKAIELNGNYLRAYLRRAALYEETDKLNEAFEDYKKILELDPGNKRATSACLVLKTYEDWQEEVALRQQAIFRNLGDRQWDKLQRIGENSVFKILLKKVSYLYFGTDYWDTKLTDENKKIVRKTVKKIISLSGNLNKDLSAEYENIVHETVKKIKSLCGNSEDLTIKYEKVMHETVKKIQPFSGNLDEDLSAENKKVVRETVKKIRFLSRNSDKVLTDEYKKVVSETVKKIKCLSRNPDKVVARYEKVLRETVKEIQPLLSGNLDEDLNVEYEEILHETIKKIKFLPENSYEYLTTHLTAYVTAYVTAYSTTEYVCEAAIESLFALESCYFHVAFVYVRSTQKQEEGCMPLIRICFRDKIEYLKENEIIFVELQPGRVYHGWTDYLKNNKLPKCNMCYPCGGIYVKRNDKTKLVKVEFGKSPACDAVNIVDTAAVITNVAASGLFAASLFFPPVAAVTGLAYGSAATAVAASTYSASRSGYHLYNMKKHDESIGLNNSEAVMHWLNLGSNVLSGLTVGGTSVVKVFTPVAQVAEVETWTTTIMNALKSMSGKAPAATVPNKWVSQLASALMVLRYVSAATNTLGIITCMMKLCMKLKDKGSLDKSDLLLFSCACLFFANIIISEACADYVIRTLSDKPTEFGIIFQMTSGNMFVISRVIKKIHSMADVLNKILPRDVRFKNEFKNGSKITSLIESLWKRDGTETICAELLKCLNTFLDKYVSFFCDETRSQNMYWLNKLSSFSIYECIMAANEVLKVIDISTELYRNMVQLVRSKFFNIVLDSLKVEVNLMSINQLEKKLVKRCKILSERMINDFTSILIVKESNGIDIEHIDIDTKRSFFDKVCNRNRNWNLNCDCDSNYCDIDFEQLLYSEKNVKCFVIVQLAKHSINLDDLKTFAQRSSFNLAEFEVDESDTNENRYHLSNSTERANFLFSKQGSQMIGICLIHKEMDRLKEMIATEVRNATKPLIKRIAALESELQTMKTDMIQTKQFEKFSNEVSQKQDEAEQYGRRNGLRFFGIPESKGEVTDM